jgi:[ribosomal protein S18]-alanine N-acetyltransferase
MVSPDGVVPKLAPMRAADLLEVLAIENRAYPTPWSAGVFADCLNTGYAAWVMRLDGQLVGYGLMSMAAGEAHILNLCVAPEKQGQGWGRYLLRHLLEIARHAATETVFLEVRVSNDAALALYVADGFVEIGRRPDYYPCAEGGTEEARVLSKRLVD